MPTSGIHKSRSKGDPWRHLTVQSHVAAPVVTQSERRQRKIQALPKGDPWSHLTVQSHVAAPVVTQSELIQQKIRHGAPLKHVAYDHIPTPITLSGNSTREIRDHVLAPVITPSNLAQQRKRQAHHAPTQRNRNLRRKIKAEHLMPTQLLIDNYCKRKAATGRFPCKITPGHIRDSMRRYEQILEKACAEVERSCASCGEFGSELIIVKKDQVYSMELKLGTHIELDKCGFVDDEYQLCGSCYGTLKKGKPPKFSAMNGVNVTMCQDYPPELEDLTLTEEYAIARSHPIGTVLKLKPNGLSHSAAYNGIRGHIVTIPQNPGPLLDILPSPKLQFHDSIAIVWTGSRAPTIDDLKPFAEVRKDKVIRALLWLCEHNPLYKSVRINHELIDQWAESFIPPILQEEVINVPEDQISDERGTYAGDMEGLSENDLHNALDDMANNTIASGAVYSDIDGQRQNPELQMVTALMKMLEGPRETTSDADAQRPVDIPVITWTGGNRLNLMNDYEDPEYFTGAFPTLFPYGKGGHLPASNERKTNVSIETWGKWLMNHHSRRQVAKFISLYREAC
jgi:hypothetical protein